MLDQNLYSPYLCLEKPLLKRRTKTSERELLGSSEHYINPWGTGKDSSARDQGVPGGGCQEEEPLIR